MEVLLLSLSFFMLVARVERRVYTWLRAWIKSVKDKAGVSGAEDDIPEDDIPEDDIDGEEVILLGGGGGGRGLA